MQVLIIEPKRGGMLALKGLLLSFVIGVIANLALTSTGGDARDKLMWFGIAFAIGAAYIILSLVEWKRQRAEVKGEALAWIMAVILIASAASGLLAFDGSPSESGSSTRVQSSAQNNPDVVSVTYVVDGCLEASVSYRNASGGTEQQLVAPWETRHGKVQLTPWILEFQEPSGYVAYISAQGEPVEGVESSEYEPGCHVQLKFNGQVVQEADSGSYYGIATASARVP
jgi:hypothetical protein